MLQIQPEKDIVIEFIKQDEFKYVRCLGATYLRLTGNSLECYEYLEPLLSDFRRIKTMNKMGAYEVTHIDEFIDLLLNEVTFEKIVTTIVTLQLFSNKSKTVIFRIGLARLFSLDYKEGRFWKKLVS